MNPVSSGHYNLDNDMSLKTFSTPNLTAADNNKNIFTLKVDIEQQQRQDDEESKDSNSNLNSPKQAKIEQNLNNKFDKKYFKSVAYKRLKHMSERNLLYNLLIRLSKFIVNFLSLAIIVIYFAVQLPIIFLRTIIFKFLLFCNLLPIEQQQIQQQDPQQQQQQLDSDGEIGFDNYPVFLTPMELFWLHDSKFNKSIGSSLFFIEGNLNKNLIKDLIKNRIIMAATRNGKRLYPRFTQILKYIWGFGYTWTYTSTFNIDDHVHEIKNNIQTNEDLQQELVNLTSTDLSKDKPLWHVYYKQNFGPERNTILIFLYHMCFSDGVSLIRIFFKSLVDNRLAIDLKPRFAYKNLTFNLIKQFLFGWQRIFYDYFIKAKDMNALRIPNLNGKKHVYWSEPFNFVNANRLKLVTRSTMNDLLMSVLSSIMRKYLQELNFVTNPNDMNFIMPIDLRSNRYPLNLGQQSTLTTFKVPTNTEGCIPRLWCIRNVTTKMKKSADFLSIYILINIIFYTLPHSLASLMIRNIFNSSSVMTSSIAAGNSSLSTVSVASRSVKNMIYFHPAISNIALSCSIITYGDEIRLSIVADSGVISNPEFITSEFIRQV